MRGTHQTLGHRERPGRREKWREVRWKQKTGSPPLRTTTPGRNAGGKGGQPKESKKMRGGLTLNGSEDDTNVERKSKRNALPGAEGKLISRARQNQQPHAARAVEREGIVIVGGDRATKGKN